MHLTEKSWWVESPGPTQKLFIKKKTTTHEHFLRYFNYPIFMIYQCEYYSFNNTCLSELDVW